MRIACLFSASLLGLWLLSPVARAADYQPWEVLNWGEGAADTLDPHTTRSTTDVTAKINLYDGLYRYDGVELAPALATGHTVSDDGLTWTFTLRQGAKFHSGNEVTSDDVVYSVRRLLGLKQAPSAPFWPILKPDNVIATGRYSVSITLDKPYAPFLAAIPLIGIVDKAVVESHAINGDWAATWVAANDAGSGPYRTEPGTFRPSQSLTLTWFPDYFLPWGQKPIKQVNITTIKEATTLALALLKGEIDATDTRISADTIDRIRKGNNVHVAGEQSMRTFVLTMDNARPPFDNIHVRKAISYAFDYDGFIGTLREGTVVRNVGPIPQNLWGNPGDLIGYRHDVNKAKAEIELARQNGVDLSRQLVLYGFTNTRDTYLASQLLQSNLRQIGLKVEIKDTFFPNLASMAANPDTAPDMWFHWVSAFFIDPANWIGEMYDSQFEGTWKASAYYRNPTVDALLRKALATPDQDTRRGLYEEASRLVVADAPALWIYNAVEYRGLSNRVQGYRFSPVGGGAYFRVMSLSE
jgi:peptide/nickel transport system substrate-binding protein